MHEYFFYRQDTREFSAPPSQSFPLLISTWSPRRDGRPTGLFASTLNLTWWAADACRVFPRDDLRIYLIHDGERVFHRLLVTPRWYRFPFMAPDDLQLGMLWTDPGMRGRGLARHAIRQALHDYQDCTSAMWYVVERTNARSIALIESLNYQKVGEGRRTRPAGISVLGRFEITRYV